LPLEKRLSLDNIEPPLNALYSFVNSVDPDGKFGDRNLNLRKINLQPPNPGFHLTHVLPQAIHCAANVAKVLKDQVLGFGHVKYLDDLLCEDLLHENVQKQRPKSVKIANLG
jgi:hypothetical protein